MSQPEAETYTVNMKVLQHVIIKLKHDLLTIAPNTATILAQPFTKCLDFCTGLTWSNAEKMENGPVKHKWSVWH